MFKITKNLYAPKKLQKPSLKSKTNKYKIILIIYIKAMLYQAVFMKEMCLNRKYHRKMIITNNSY